MHSGKFLWKNLAFWFFYLCQCFVSCKLSWNFHWDFFWLFVTAHQAKESAKTAEMEIQMSSKIDNGEEEVGDSG